MKITRTQLRKIIREAVGVDNILPATKRMEMFQDAYEEGYETAFDASESPDSDPDEPYWTVYGPYAIKVADYEDQREAEAVSDALNAEYREYLEAQDPGGFGSEAIDYPTSWHNT